MVGRLGQNKAQKKYKCREADTGQQRSPAVKGVISHPWLGGQPRSQGFKEPRSQGVKEPRRQGAKEPRNQRAKEPRSQEAKGQRSRSVQVVLSDLGLCSQTDPVECLERAADHDECPGEDGALGMHVPGQLGGGRGCERIEGIVRTKVSSVF